MPNRNETKGRSVEQRKNGSCFDYSALPSSAAEFLKGQAHRIRRQAAISVVRIGKDLLAAKHYLSHGAFLNWVEAEVGIPARTAQAYMQVAQWASRKSTGVSLLPPSILYVLSAPSTPESYANDILRRIEAGEHIAPPIIRSELRSLRARRLEGNPDKRDVLQQDRRGLPLPIKIEANIALHRAVTILARGLSTEDFTQVRSILTSETVLEDPKLASKIVAAFSMSTSNGTEIYEVGAIGRGAPKAEGLTESNVNRA
jgi:hypothetical protein